MGFEDNKLREIRMAEGRMLKYEDAAPLWFSLRGCALSGLHGLQFF
jgi:hypothetical protein